MQTFKLFVSSPGDVMAERRRVENIASRLNGEFAGVARLEVIRWETQNYQAFSTFQSQIPRSVDCDLVIGILKWRLGTELPPDFDEKLPDGKSFPSGTAYEILTAIEKRQRGLELPDIYVFRFTGSSPAVAIEDPDREKIERDWQALKEFFQAWFLTAQGYFKGAFNSYTSEDDLEAQLLKLIRDWLTEKVAGGRVVQWPIEVKGSPFCGLAAFDARHAPVFFGRSHDIARAVELWRDAGQRKSPYLLVIGASGSGKSSLARAGLLPRLTTPGVISEVGIWRVAVMRPGDSPQGPFAALAAALMQSEAGLSRAEEGRGAALPEIALGDSRTPADFAAVLRHADGSAIRPIVNALETVAKHEQGQENYAREIRCDLVLLIDQLDELFAASVADADRNGFLDLIAAMAATGRIWIVTTLRADLYPRMLEQPALKKLKELGATYDLAPPGPVELAEIVRSPAAAAGLVYETDAATGERLDARLLRDAEQPDMLPLVQLALSRLFEGRQKIGSDLLLPLAVYQGLGGLKGIIDEAGERAISSVGATEQAQLPKLLRQLAVPARDQSLTAGNALTIRAAPLSEAAPDPATRALLDSLVAARLLTLNGTEDATVANGDDAGEKTRAAGPARSQVRLTHQRILEDWNRARTIVAESSDFYRIRSDLEESYRRWEAGKHRSELLLPRGLPLIEATGIVDKYSTELSSETLAYVRRSKKRAQLAQIISWSLAVFFFVLSVAATGAGLIAYREYQTAERAEQSTSAALERAQLTDSRRLLNVVSTGIADPTIGALLSLEGLPTPDDKHPRPVVPALQTRLYDFTNQLTELLDLDSAVKSPDGLRLAVGNSDNSLSIYDLRKYNIPLQLKGHSAKINDIVFSRDGRLIATASADKTARIWDVETGRVVAVLDSHTDAVTRVSFDDSDKIVVTGSGDGSVRTWSAVDGKPMAVFAGHEGGVQGWSTSFGARRIATVSKQQIVRLWNIDTGQELARPDSDDAASVASRGIDATSVSLNGKANRLLITRQGKEQRAILWNIPDAKAVASFDKVGTGNRFLDGDRLIELLPLGTDGGEDQKWRMNDPHTSTEWRLVDGESGTVIDHAPIGYIYVLTVGDGFVVVFDSFEDLPTAKFWDRQKMTLRAELHDLVLLGFASNATQFVSREAGGDITVRQIDTGTLVKTIPVPAKARAIAPPGEELHQILVQDGEGKAELLDLQSGAKIADLDSSSQSPADWNKQINFNLENVQFGQNGKLIAAQLGDLKVVRVWESPTGKVVGDIAAPGDIKALSLNADGTKLLISGTDSSGIWSLDPWMSDSIASINRTALTFGKGGNTLEATDEDDQLGLHTVIWRTDTAPGIFKDESLTGRARYAVGQPHSVVVFASSHDLKQLGIAVPGDEKSKMPLYVVDLDAGQVVSSMASDTELSPIAASPGGNRVLLGNPLAVWDTATGAKLLDVGGANWNQFEKSQFAAFSHDGQRLCLVSAGDRQITVDVWDISKKIKVGSQTVSVPSGAEGDVNRLVNARFSLDDRRIGVLLATGTRVLTFDASNAAPLLGLDVPNSYEWSAGGKWILSSGSDDRWLLRDIDTGSTVNLGAIASGSDSNYQIHSFSPDESKLAFATADHVQIWDTASGSRSTACAVRHVRNIAFGPDNASVALATDYGRVNICDLATGKVRQLQQATTESAVVSSGGLAFSNDGTSIIYSHDNLLEVIPTDGSGTAMTADFGNEFLSPGHKYLVSSSNTAMSDVSFPLDSKATVHRLFPDTASLVVFAQSRLARCLTPPERKQYSLDAEPPLWCIRMAKWPYNTAEWARWLGAREAGKPIDLPEDPRFAARH